MNIIKSFIIYCTPYKLREFPYTIKRKEKKKIQANIYNDYIEGK